MRTPRRQLITPTLLALALVWPIVSGCSAGDEPPVEDEQRPEAERLLTGRFAHLSVTSRNALGRDRVPMSVSAQFVEYDGVDVWTVRRSLDIWSPSPNDVEEQCRIESDATAIDPRDWYTSEIELLHAGSVIIDAGEQEVELGPRRMPELLPYLSGFTYGTDGNQELVYEAGLPIDIWSVGGDRVSDFDVALEMPDPIAITYVGGQAVGSAGAVDISLDHDVLVLWEPTIQSDLVYLILEEDGIDRLATLSCTAYDDGAFLISAEALQALLGDHYVGRIRLTLRRANLEPIELGEFDRAEAVTIAEHSVILY